MIHHIHHVDWRLLHVWWVEREEKIICKTQGNPQVSHKGLVNVERRRCIRWSRSSEYLWRKNQVLGYTDGQPNIHTFGSREEVQWECTWIMEGNCRQIAGVRLKTRRSKWGDKQVGNMKYQKHKARPWHIVQWTLLFKFEVQENQGEILEQRRWYEVTLI